MRLHRLYPRRIDALEGPPSLTSSSGFGLSSWLIGFDLERHPYEWTLVLRLGPLGLWIERVR